MTSESTAIPESLTPTTLRPLEERPFGFGGGTIPIDLARWLRTNPVDRIDPAEEGWVRLWSGISKAVTPFGHHLDLGGSTTLDGRRSMVGMPTSTTRQIDAIIEWELRNPEERPMGVPTLEIHVLKACVNALMEAAPPGRVRAGLLDRLLSLTGQGMAIVDLRNELRRDPDDALDTTSDIADRIAAL